MMDNNAEKNQLFIELKGRKLVYDDIYVFYDSPLLFSALDQFGMRYIVDAIDFEPEGTRWMICQISNNRFLQAVTGIIPVYDVFRNPESKNLYIVLEDRDEGIVKQCDLVPACSIPDGDLPVKGEYIESSMRPVEAMAHFHILEKGEEYQHAADALSVSDFIKSFINAVNAKAKDILGLERKHSNIQLSAFAFGSLDVVLQVPQQPIKGRQKESINDLGVQSTEESVDAIALRTISRIISHASDDTIDKKTLDQELSNLPDDSRHALNGVAKVVQQSGWEIKGNINRPKALPDIFTFTSIGALRLINSLESIPENPEAELLVGYLDGYRRSDGTLFFKSNQEAKRPLQVEVHDDVLIQQVARYAMEFDSLYALEVQKIEKRDEFGSVRTTKRILTGIQKQEKAIQGSINS